MTIQDSNMIDSVDVDKDTGNIVMTIVDDVPVQENSKRHLALLQEKLNTYLNYKESGKLDKKHPDAADRKLEVLLLRDHPVYPKLFVFLQEAGKIFEESGYLLQCKQAK